MSTIYIGLDIATVTGIAVYKTTFNKAEVIQYRGSPLSLMSFIRDKVLDLGYYKPIFVLEEPLHFRNAIVTRSLLTRYGFIKYSFMDYN